MDLLIILTYVAFAWTIFKIFRIPVNQWTLATATLGGVFIVAGLILLMNYNHPYTFTAQKAVISIPITPQVTGVVSEVTDKNNQLIKKGEVLFKIDPTRYQARVDRLKADLVTATHNIKVLKAQLSEAQSNTTRVSAERDRLYKDYQRYLKGSQAKVNPFSESDIDNARQNYLAQDAMVKGSVAEQTQIQSQLDSMSNGEQSQIASLRAQLTEATYNLDQTVIRAPSNGYVTQVLIRPGTYAASLPVKGSVAEQTQIQSQLDSMSNGEQSQIASLRAQLTEATYNLDQTVIRAPSNGYVTQVLIRPGTYAASLPLRPVMVFIPEQKRQIVAQFRQNSLLRLKPGDEAEVVFNALPGQVFSGKLTSILPVVPGGSYQAQGVLQSLTVIPGTDGVLGTIELDPNADVDALPDGIYAQVAVYSDHFSHVSVMRKVLLRMTSWMHYLYLDH